MTDTEIKECQEWLDKLKLDDIPKGYKWQRSLMDITGIKHHENMWSDIYKFFFNEKEGHNMKDQGKRIKILAARTYSPYSNQL